MKRPIPKAVEMEAPLGPIESNKLFDEDAAAVIEFAEQEKQMEREQELMMENDPIRISLREKLGEGAAAEAQMLEGAGEPATPGSSAPLRVQGPSSATGQQMQQDDPGLAVPVTPPREYIMVDSPRTPPESRPAEDVSEKL